MDKQRLTDAEARRLLERASELDVEQSQSLDISTVREIATEAGISPAALEAALREDAIARQPAVKRWTPVRRILAVGRVASAILLVYVLMSVIARLFG